MSIMLTAAVKADAVISAAPKGSDKIDLAGSWDTFWKAITAATGAGKIFNLLAIVGVAIVALALVKWAWDRRRGQGGGMGRESQAVWGALLVGALLSAPGVIIPILLTFMDVIVNAGLSVWDNTPKA